MPVVVPAKDINKLPIRVAAAAKEMLIAIGVPLDLVEEEMRQMQNGYLAVTKSRKILGSLNDFMYHFERSYHERQGLTLQEHAIRLANIPFAAIEYAYSSEATRAKFA